MGRGSDGVTFEAIEAQGVARSRPTQLHFLSVTIAQLPLSKSSQSADLGIRAHTGRRVEGE